MKAEELTRWLAENVLGWTAYPDSCGGFGIVDAEGRSVSFDPLNDMNDAMRLLEGFPTAIVCKGYGSRAVWSCCINSGHHNSYADTPKKAIMLAVAKAHGCPQELLEALENED